MGRWTREGSKRKKYIVIDPPESCKETINPIFDGSDMIDVVSGELRKKYYIGSEKSRQFSTDKFRWTDNPSAMAVRYDLLRPHLLRAESVPVNTGTLQQKGNNSEIDRKRSEGLYQQISAGGGPFPLTTFLTCGLISTQKETPYLHRKAQYEA